MSAPLNVQERRESIAEEMEALESFMNSDKEAPEGFDGSTEDMKGAIRNLWTEYELQGWLSESKKAIVKALYQDLVNEGKISGDSSSTPGDSDE